MSIELTGTITSSIDDDGMLLEIIVAEGASIPLDVFTKHLNACMPQINGAMHLQFAKAWHEGARDEECQRNQIVSLNAFVDEQGLVTVNARTLHGTFTAWSPVTPAALN